MTYSQGMPIVAVRHPQVAAATPSLALFGSISSKIYWHDGCRRREHATPHRRHRIALEVLRDEEDDDELLSVLMTCQRALRDFEFAILDLVELESEIRRANTTSEVEEFDDRIDR